MKNIYLVRSKFSNSINFVKGETEKEVVENFLYHEYSGVDSFQEERKERYKNNILKNFEIVQLGNFNNHNICETSIFAYVKYEDSNEIELTIEVES